MLVTANASIIHRFFFYNMRFHKKERREKEFFMYTSIKINAKRKIFFMLSIKLKVWCVKLNLLKSFFYKM